jgi:hypothetical protein
MAAGWGRAVNLETAWELGQSKGLGKRSRVFLSKTVSADAATWVKPFVTLSDHPRLERGHRAEVPVGVSRLVGGQRHASQATRRTSLPGGPGADSRLRVMRLLSHRV